MLYRLSKEEMELALFREVKIPKDVVNDSMLQEGSIPYHSELVIGGKYNIKKVIETDGKKAIVCYRDLQRIYLDEVEDYHPVGTYLLEESKIIFGTITEEIFNTLNEEMKRIQINYRGESLYWKLERCVIVGEITPSAIKTSVNQIVKIAHDEIDTEIAEREAGAKRRAQEREEWEEQGKYDNIDGNVITCGSQTIEIDKWWKELIPSRDNSTSHIGTALSILQNAGYEGDIKIKPFHGKTLIIHLENRNTTIDGIKVTKSRVYPLTRRLIHNEIEREDIKTYNGLSNIKMDLAMSKSVKVSRGSSLKLIDLPYTVKFLSKDRVRVNAFGKGIEMDYARIAKLLVDGRSVETRLSPDEYFNMTTMFGLDRKEALTMLKNYATLGEI